MCSTTISAHIDTEPIALPLIPIPEPHPNRTRRSRAMCSSLFITAAAVSVAAWSVNGDVACTGTDTARAAHLYLCSAAPIDERVSDLMAKLSDQDIIQQTWAPDGKNQNASQ